MVDVRWCACIHGISPNLDQHQNGFDLVFVCFCQFCQNLDEQLLAGPARCSLKDGLLKVSSSLQQRTHQRTHHPKFETFKHYEKMGFKQLTGLRQPRSGDILPIVRCGSFKTIVDLDDFDALSCLLFFQSLQDLPITAITIMLVTGNDTNWQRDRIWQFQMLLAFNNDQKCPFLVLTKLWEDPRKLLNLLTLLRVMTLFYLKQTGLCDHIESDRTSDIFSDTYSYSTLLLKTTWHRIWCNFWHMIWHAF